MSKKVKVIIFKDAAPADVFSEAEKSDAVFECSDTHIVVLKSMEEAKKLQEMKIPGVLVECDERS